MATTLGSSDTTSKLLDVDINELMPDANQVRTVFDPEAIERLAASVRARGIHLPLRVLFDEERRCWRIVTGECRWRAAKLAGLATVPCLPVEGDLSETDIISDQIIENSVRNDLSPLDLARALSKLKALKKCTSQALAAELGISAASISRSESLLGLPEDIQARVDSGEIPASVGYELTKVNDPETQHFFAEEVASKRLKRDRLVEEVRGLNGKRTAKPKSSRLACRLDGGIAITVTSGQQPLDFESLIAALDRIRKAARKLCDDGKDVTALAKVLRAS